MKNEKGGLFIEFLIFFIMLISLTMGVVEFTTLFLTKEKVTHLARESANLAFNTCKKSNNSVTNVQNCYVKNEIEKQILDLEEVMFGNNKNNIKVIFSFWGTRDENNVTIPPTRFMFPSVLTSSPNPDISGKTSTLNAAILKLFAFQGVDSISAEVFYKFKPITPLGKLLEPSGIIPKIFYETAIF